MPLFIARVKLLCKLARSVSDGLKFENLGTKSISGWAYDYGKGRVVFTAVGHTIHAMWNPQYIEIQKRSIRWLLKQI
jgi:type 1 glutamine amidotransferase